VRVFAGFSEYRYETLLREFSKGAHLGDPRPALFLTIGVVLLALVVAGVRRAVVVAGVMGLANLTTVLLASTLSVTRPPLPEPDLWPSNHTTAVAAAGLSLVLIFRGRLRWLAALLGLGMCVGIALMLLIRGTHLLSDIVAAVLVCGFWAVLGAQVADAHASS
jgi:membrane-associated PAP2 superfamily phosphatase